MSCFSTKKYNPQKTTLYQATGTKDSIIKLKKTKQGEGEVDKNYAIKHAVTSFPTDDQTRDKTQYQAKPPKKLKT